MKTKLFLFFFSICVIANAQWQNTNCPMPQLNCVATQGAIVIAGTAGSGIRGSIDNANTWTVCCAYEMTFPYINSLVVDGTTFFAASLSGVYKSTDSAVSWTQINNGLMDTSVYSMAIGSGNIYAGTAHGVYLSTNNGDNWIAVNNGLTSNLVRALAVSGTNIYAGTNGGGVFLSTNNGSSWTAINNGLTSGNINCITVGNGNIYIGTSDAGIFKSSDNGANWNPVNNGLLNSNVESIVISGSIVFAGTSGGVYSSINNGSNWTSRNEGFTNSSITGLSISGANIFASIYMGGIWKRPISEIASINGFNNKKQVNIYPNPAMDKVFVDLQNFDSENATLELFSMEGRLLLKQTVVPNSVSEIDLQSLPSGMFVLKVRDKNHNVVRLMNKM